MRCRLKVHFIFPVADSGRTSDQDEEQESCTYLRHVGLRLIQVEAERDLRERYARRDF